MSNPWLDQHLFTLNSVEQMQRASHGNVNYMDLDYIHNPIPQMPRSDFFKDGDLAVTKNSRFSYVPAHTHSFIELNYMYSGTCTQYINGEQVTLHKHNLILMDKDIVQQIESTGEHDLLVNILVKDDSAMNRLFDYMPVETNQITEFLYNASQINTLHNNFILFDLTDRHVAIDLVESLIMKGLTHDRLRNRSMGFLFSALILELSQSIEQEYINFANNNDHHLLPIIEYINQNFASVSLAAVSAKFNYNTNYLGNKLKNATGKTFKELVDQRRLSAAQNLMIKTNCTLPEICAVVGYENTSSLFRLFKKHLHTTPSAYKRKVSGKNA